MQLKAQCETQNDSNDLNNYDEKKACVLKCCAAIFFEKKNVKMMV